MSKYKALGAYSALVGALYCLYGILDLANGTLAWWTPYGNPNWQVGLKVGGSYVPLAVADPFLGLVLLIVGIVFIRGSRHLWRRSPEAWGYAAISLILAGAIAGMCVLISVANAIGAYYPLLFGEEAGTWTGEWILNAATLLSPLALPFLLLVKEREKLLRRRGVSSSS